ncbi:MAG: histidinol-phosphatase HisJ family protein [Lachnospiraceae bacterium]|nr:histidinol-phosphatase HisJ family protein [Lachnospiraceae bacterium]
MLMDYHVHTCYSDDSSYPMEEVVRDAIKIGLDEICFTDHVDYGVKLDREGKSAKELEGNVLNVDYPDYFREIDRLRQKYGDRITIKQGMEFGIQTHTIPAFEKLFSVYDFDFIILSCHQVGDKEFWNQNFQREHTQQEYNELYYDEIWKVIQKYKNYSVLGHLDLIKRYDRQGNYPYEKVKPIITEILKQVIADGKGLEVNTSCFRYGLSDLTPSAEILTLYRELGGKILTIGSDSHAPKHLGAHIPEVLVELKQLGFDSICTYRRMEPIFHKMT